MKLYMIRGFVDNTSWGGDTELKEVCLGFVGTQAQTKKALKAIREQCPDISSVYHEPVEVPTNKAGLLAWLNSYGRMEVDSIINDVLS